MMKRFALAAVVALSLFSLTACSGEEKQETTPSPAVEEATPAATTEGDATTQAGTDSMEPATDSVPATTETATN